MAVHFNCPNCDALYQRVTAEAGPETAHNEPLGYQCHGHIRRNRTQRLWRSPPALSDERQCDQSNRLATRLCVRRAGADAVTAETGIGPIFSPSGPNAELYGAADGYPVPNPSLARARQRRA
jgi:hypothetical protein